MQLSFNKMYGKVGAVRKAACCLGGQFHFFGLSLWCWHKFMYFLPCFLTCVSRCTGGLCHAPEIAYTLGVWWGALNESKEGKVITHYNTQITETYVCTSTFLQSLKTMVSNTLPQLNSYIHCWWLRWNGKVWPLLLYSSVTFGVLDSLVYVGSQGLPGPDYRDRVTSWRPSFFSIC